MIEIVTTLKEFLALGRPPDPEKLKALLLRSKVKKASKSSNFKPLESNDKKFSA